MNIATIKIDNCLNCPHHFVDRIWTADSFEHESGCFCMLVREDDMVKKEFHRQEQKMVGCDDWHLERYTKVPDWCPLIKKVVERLV